MGGAIALAVAIVIVLPVMFLTGGAVVAAIMGWSLKEWGDASHEGSELIELNR